jgi:hypothetical protein
MKKYSLLQKEILQFYRECVKFAYKKEVSKHLNRGKTNSWIISVTSLKRT